MRIAIALFGDRVAPRFDCTQDFLLVTLDNDKILMQEREKIREIMSVTKIKQLADLDVDTMICGGVDSRSREYFDHYGIRILANIKGEANEALQHCLKKDLLVKKPAKKKFVYNLPLPLHQH